MAQTIDLATSRVPVYRTSDVVVVGGGIAGISAALAAARQGKRVTLLEKQIALGGLATMGHVCVYLPLDDGRGHTVYHGQAEELLYACIKYGFDTLPAGYELGVDYLEHPAGRYQTTFNIPAAVMAFDELLGEVGVEVVFDAVFSEPVMEGERVRAVVCETKEGRVAFSAEQFVDASGDADLMARAGAAVTTKDSICSHWTFELDMDTARKGVKTEDVLNCLQLRWIGAKPHGGTNAYPVPEFSGTTIEGVNGYIRQSRGMALEFLKKNQRPGYAMMTLPTMAQLRTTRHIRGAESLDFTRDADRRRDDSVGIVCHGIMNPSPVFEYPYGGLIDTRVENVYAAGRIVACDSMAGWEMMRLVPACAFTGQVAGTAAALARELGVCAQELPIARLQGVLAEGGVRLHMDDCMRGNLNRKSTVDPTWNSLEHVCFDDLGYLPEY